MAFTPLNSLHAFVAVARRLSYSAAAKDLGVSTSALSQSVRLLEGRVGAALLTRTSRSVALTDAGQRLLEHAGHAVDDALASLKAVNAKSGEVSGRVRLTAPTVAVDVLSQLLPNFFALHPKVEVEVSVDDQLVDTVAQGLDAGVRLVEAIARDMVHVRLTAPAADFPEAIREAVKSAFTPASSDAVMRSVGFLDNFVLGARAFSETEQAYYRKPFLVPGEDRRPMAGTEFSIDGKPEDTTKVMGDDARWLSESEVPKLMIDAEPGHILTGRLRDFARTWRNQTEVTVKGGTSSKSPALAT
jgi:hypothetical protein